MWSNYSACQPVFQLYPSSIRPIRLRKISAVDLNYDFTDKLRVPIVQNRNIFTYHRLYERLVIGVVSSFLLKNCLIRVIFVTGRNSLHYCYDVSYQCWFASEEAKIYCNNFNSSNGVVCSHLILAYTESLAIKNVVELERNGWCYFFYLYWGMLCCDWKEHRQKSLKIELVTKYDTKDA